MAPVIPKDDHLIGILRKRSIQCIDTQQAERQDIRALFVAAL